MKRAKRVKKMNATYETRQKSQNMGSTYETRR